MSFLVRVHTTLIAPRQAERMKISKGISAVAALLTMVFASGAAASVGDAARASS